MNRFVIGLFYLGTRWTERVDSIKPFARNLPGIIKALEELRDMPGLPTKTKAETIGAIKYMSSFTCVLMSTTWYKILLHINNVNLIIEARQTTLDVEASNIESLISDLSNIRGRWDDIYNETVSVATVLGFLNNHAISGIRRVLGADIGEEYYKINVFYAAIDSVLSSLSVRFRAIREVSETFGFVWKITFTETHFLSKQLNKFSEKIFA